MANTNSTSNNFELEPISNNINLSESLKNKSLLEIIKKKKETLNNTFIRTKLNNNNFKINEDIITFNKNKEEKSSINPCIFIAEKESNNKFDNPIANSFETGFNIVNNKFDSLNTCNYSDLVSSFESTISLQTDDQDEDIFQYQNDI